MRYEDRLCLDLENARKLYERDRLRAQDSSTLRHLIDETNKEFGL